jgi:hypothetical protein
MKQPKLHLIEYALLTGIGIVAVCAVLIACGVAR